MRKSELTREKQRLLWEGFKCFFSEYYGIDSSVVEHYGAVDISFVCDIPLFIDPILEYEDNKKRNKRSVNERSVKKIENLVQKGGTHNDSI